MIRANEGILEEKETPKNTSSNAKKGDPTIPPGMNGVGKLISPNATNGLSLLRSGLSKTVGNDAMKSLAAKCVCPTL